MYKQKRNFRTQTMPGISYLLCFILTFFEKYPFYWWQIVSLLIAETHRELWHLPNCIYTFNLIEIDYITSVSNWALLIMWPMFRIRASSEQKYSDVLCWVCYLSREFKREKRKEKNAQVEKCTHSYGWLLSSKAKGPPKTVLFKRWKPSDLHESENPGQTQVGPHE